ncbi:unnamed protein product [Diamesa serratosioi]
MSQSGHQYISNANSLFSDDNEVDDEMFLQNSRLKNPVDKMEEQRQVMVQKRKEIENRTLASSQRSVGLLRETENVGIATAQELHHQRQQLEKTQSNLDDINSTLRFSQKHLNGLKSVFGGLKNYLSGKNDYGSKLTSPTEGKISEESSSSIGSPTDQSRENQYESHPTTRLRNDLDQQQAMNGGFNEQLDRNLDDMADSLSRLRGLAIDLDQEITSQNFLIDDISNKTEDVDLKIGKQNKDMHKILGKK